MESGFPRPGIRPQPLDDIDRSLRNNFNVADHNDQDDQQQDSQNNCHNIIHPNIWLFTAFNDQLHAVDRKHTHPCIFRDGVCV